MRDDLPITTTRKSGKLRRGLSYPVGAEIISEALGDLSSRMSIGLSFLFPTTWRGGNLEKLIEKTPSYLVLGISFRRPLKPTISTPNYLIEKAFTEHWDIIVYAVPSVHRAKVRSLLIDSGIETARKWMESGRPPSWPMGGSSYYLSYDSRSGQLSANEPP